LPPDGFRRDGIVIEIEAHIDGLARVHSLDPFGGEGVQRRRQQAGLFFSKDIGERAVVAAGPTALVRDLVAPE
jgi:hypothetical protein